MSKWYQASDKVEALDFRTGAELSFSFKLKRGDIRMDFKSINSIPRGQKGRER